MRKRGEWTMIYPKTRNHKKSRPTKSISIQSIFAPAAAMIRLAEEMISGPIPSPMIGVNHSFENMVGRKPLNKTTLRMLYSATKMAL